jgi:acetylglutamate kinase
MSVIVIKYGGSLLEEPGHRTAFLKDVAALFKKQDVILVHGGGTEISRQMEQAGLKPKFVNGRRYTDAATMAVVKKALSNLNAEIVAELGKLGVPAFGRSGQEDHLMEAEIIQELGRAGLPKKVNAAALETVLKKKAMSVFYSVAEDTDHQPLNVNADDFALILAITCRADRLVFLTDTGGVLDGRGILITRITPKEAALLEETKVITGGMLVKVKACMDALARGVGGVDIVKGIGYLVDPTCVKPEGTMFSHGY